MRKYYLALSFVTGLAASQANATILSIILDSPFETGSPGDVLSFTGTITKTGPDGRNGLHPSATNTNTRTRPFRTSFLANRNNTTAKHTRAAN